MASASIDKPRERDASARQSVVAMELGLGASGAWLEEALACISIGSDVGLVEEGMGLIRRARRRARLQQSNGSVFDLRVAHEPRTFELPQRSRVTRACRCIGIVEVRARVVPAAIARMEIDHAVRRVEFADRMRESADQHDGRADRPRKPREIAGHADQARRMPQPPCALCPRRVGWKNVRDLRERAAFVGDIGRRRIDADDPIAGRRQKSLHLPPAAGPLPARAAQRALRGDADIAARERPAVVGELDARRRLARIDAEHVRGAAMHADELRRARLVRARFVAGKAPEPVCRVIALGLDELGRHEFDVRIARLQQRDQRRRHRAREPATMLPLEFHGIAEPAERFAEPARLELNQHRLAVRVELVLEDALLARVDFDLERHEVPARARDDARADLRVEQRRIGVHVAQADRPVAVGQQHAAAVVEVEAHAFGAGPGRYVGGRCEASRMRWRLYVRR
ncbi:hypothetical protein Y024_4433 [Burkholderia pseudomallei TSV44]|nr:hypothetical protein Y024_4433 [Burkholderia pseudomallei TSV44]